MNTKLSGAQLVLVPIVRKGENYFPFVENIRKRVIKYVDFCPATYLPDVAAPGLTTTDNVSVTIYDEYGTQRLIDSLPLERFDYAQTIGVRQPIMHEISLERCCLNVTDDTLIGKTAAFVFWYDLPQYSSANKSDKVITDNVSIELTSKAQENQFPDDERMIGKRFRRILVSTPTITPNYKNGVAEAVLPNLYLTLRKGSYRVVDRVPLSLLRQIKMLKQSEFANIIFDFNSSYITIGGAGTNPDLGTDYIGKYVFLNLVYEK